MAQPDADKPKPAATPPPFLEGRDTFGRPVRIARDEYRKKVLPDLLKAHGSDAERLAAVLVQAVRDGFAADVVAAANRLTVVDKDLDRALSVLALVQREAGEPESAEATLKELLQRRPDSVPARVGLAMLADRRGDAAKAEALLWEALQRDCNHPDAVHGFLQVRHKVVGDAGYEAEIARLAALPGSWRAQLWLARWLLTRGDAVRAAAIYRDVLGRDEVQGDALVMASADLVQQKESALVAELVAPRFRPGRHHPHVGLALLHHHLRQQDHVAGAALLHQMYVHYGHLIAAELQPFTAEFDRLRLAKLPPPPPPKAEPRVSLYRFDRPIWYAGLEDPAWLVPAKGADARHVLLFPLALGGGDPLPAGREDDIGRLTRALPLWFAEQLWIASPQRGTAALPLTEHGSWALMGQPWPEDRLGQQVPAAERATTLLVTGQLRFEGDRRRIDLWVYDCAQQQRTGHAAAEGKEAELGAMLLQLMGELWPLLGGEQGHKPPVGGPEFWQRYAEGLGQHAALVVTEAGGMPRDRLFGERYITQWLQNVALMEARWQPGFWLLASALAVLRRLGSDVPLEHARFIAEVFRQSPPQSAFARLAVVPLRACGLETLWQARRAEIVAAAQGQQGYLGWLGRVEARPVS